MAYGKLGARLIFLLAAFCLLTSAYKPGTQRETSALDPDEAHKWQAVNSYYRVADLHAQGYSGRGVHVAVITFDTFERSDIERFSRQFGLPEPKINVIPLFGGAVHQGAAANGHVESTLDIDVVHAAAPDAVLDVYSVPPAVPFSYLLQRIKDDGQARIVTFSWGRVPNPRDDMLVYDIVGEMAQQGTTVFAYTGDTGASLDNTHLASPSYLPNVVAVGGTVVSVDRTFKAVAERDWPLSVGGWSAEYPTPAYQTAAGAAMQGNAEARKYRMVPDVVGPSIVAATDSPTAERDGLPIFVTDPQTGKGSWVPATGTSVAAPYIAGIFANIAGGLNRGLGDIHEPLYKLMKQDAFNPVAPGVKESIFGGGGAYSMSSGLGSVNAYDMAIAFGLRLK